MSFLRALLGFVLAPLRWFLEDLGGLLFGLAFFVTVMYLTGLAEGRWWLAVLILVPFTAAFLWLIFRRRASTEEE